MSAWLGEGLSRLSGISQNLGGQLTDFAKDVLAEGVEEIDDPAAALVVAKGRIAELEELVQRQTEQIGSLKTTNQELLERTESAELQVEELMTARRKAMQTTTQRHDAHLESVELFTDDPVEDSFAVPQSGAILMETSHEEISEPEVAEFELQKLTEEIQRLSGEVVTWKRKAEAADHLSSQTTALTSEVERLRSQVSSQEQSAETPTPTATVPSAWDDEWCPSGSGSEEDVLANNGASSTASDVVIVNGSKTDMQMQTSESMQDWEELQTKLEDSNAKMQRYAEFEDGVRSELGVQFSSLTELTQKMRYILNENKEISCAYNDLNEDYESHKKESDGVIESNRELNLRLESLRSDLLEYEDKYEKCRLQNDSASENVERLSAMLDRMQSQIQEAGNSSQAASMQALGNLQEQLTLSTKHREQLVKDMSLLQKRVDETGRLSIQLRAENDDLRTRLDQAELGVAEAVDVSSLRAEVALLSRVVDTFVSQPKSVQQPREPSIDSRCDSGVIDELSQLKEEHASLIGTLNLTERSLHEARERESQLSSVLENKSAENLKLENRLNMLLVSAVKPALEDAGVQSEMDERLQAAFTEMSSLQADLQGAREAETEAASNAEDYLQQIAELVQQRERMQHELSGLREQIDGLTTAAAAECQQCDTLREEIRAVRQRNEEQNVSEMLKEEINATKAKYEEQQSLLTEAQQSCSLLQLSLSEKQSQCEALQNSLVAAQKALEDMEKNAEALQSSRDQLQQTLSVTNGQIEQYNVEMQRLSMELERVGQEDTMLRNQATQYAEELAKMQQYCQQLQAQQQEQQAQLQQQQLQQQSQTQHADAEQQLTAAQQYNETLATQITSLEETSRRLSGENERLRNHLLQVEENYTHEAVRAEERESDLLERLKVAEARSLNENNEAVETQHLMQSDLEDLRVQLDAATAQRDQALHELGNTSEQLERKERAVTNLQSALQHLQQEHDSRAFDVVDKLKRENKQLLEEQTLLQSRLGEVERQFGEAQTALLDTQSLAHQMASIETAKRQVEDAEKRLAESQARLTEMQKSMDGKIEKVLIKNLVLGYFATPSSKQPEVAHLLGSVLDFTPEEFSKIEGGGGWLDFLRGAPADSSKAVMDAKSVAASFIAFLEEESKPEPQAAPISLASEHSTTVTPRTGTGTTTIPNVRPQFELPTFTAPVASSLNEQTTTIRTTSEADAVRLALQTE